VEIYVAIGVRWRLLVCIRGRWLLADAESEAYLSINELQI